MQEVLYLCDGNVETCSKTGCYKRGHECWHTTDPTHALNPEDKRRFVPDEDGNLWEVPSIMAVLAEKPQKLVSSEEALRDIIPPQWSEDILSGKKKVVVDAPKMRGCFRGTLRSADFPFVAAEKDG